MEITNPDGILNPLTDFYSSRTYDGSLLIEELAHAVFSSKHLPSIQSMPLINHH